MTPQDRGCIRLFQVGGISVLLHWSWFVVGIIELTVRADTYPSLAWNAAEYLVLFGIVLLHEFGHAFACRQVGGTAERIVLWPLGGVAYVNPPPRPGAVLWSIAAGPLVNVLLVPVTLGLALLVPRVVPPPLAAQVAAFCNAVVVVNLLLLVFNLLPIYPLDGGQILHALLWFVIGRARSLMVCSAIGVLGAAALALYALSTGSIWLIVIAAFLGIRAVAGIQIARSLAWRDPAGHLLSGAIAGAQDGDVAKALADCDRALEIIPAGNPFAAHAYAVRAQLRAKQGEHDRAVADYGEALRLLPRAAAYRIHRGHCRACLGDYDGAEKDYRAALELDRRSVTALNELAWLLATCPDSDYRDGEEAVGYATRACELSRWKEPSCLGTLGAAHAEAGDFEAAVTWQEKALEDPAYRARYGETAHRRLQLYAEGRPYHEG